MFVLFWCLIDFERPVAQRKSGRRRSFPFGPCSIGNGRWLEIRSGEASPAITRTHRTSASVWQGPSVHVTSGGGRTTCTNVASGLVFHVVSHLLWVMSRRAGWNRKLQFPAGGCFKWVASRSVFGREVLPGADAHVDVQPLQVQGLMATTLRSGRGRVPTIVVPFGPEALALQCRKV